MYNPIKKVRSFRKKFTRYVVQLILSYIATTVLNYFIKTNQQVLALRGTPAHFTKCSDSKEQWL